MFTKLEEIDVWKRGCKLVVAIYDICDQEPLSNKWSLKDQMCRSVLSIPSNIAEGFERNSQAEFKRFLHIAKGSCGELRTQLYITKAAKLCDASKIDPLIQECREISLMIGGLAKNA